MVFPNDEMEIFNEPLEMRLEATNQQLKKWLLRWKPVIDHSMKKVKEMPQTKSIPIWKHYLANKLAKTKVTRHVTTRKHGLPKNMTNNPLTNVAGQPVRHRPHYRRKLRQTTYSPRCSKPRGKRDQLVEHIR
jgi:hypothetical protein